jgi:hypothetical protein
VSASTGERLKSDQLFHAPERNADLLEKGFSPRTMYRDHAVSPTVFHWESQHTAHAGTPAGKRYSKGTSRVLLFVREHQKLPNGLAEPFVFLGPATFRSGKGERPMQIEWKLAEPMPEWLYRQAAVLAR